MHWCYTPHDWKCCSSAERACGEGKEPGKPQWNCRMSDIVMDKSIITPLRLQDLSIKEDYFIWICYASHTPSFYWRILIYTYLGILQIVGIMLAFQTRKVKVPGLNDSIHVAAIIYISSLVLVILIVDDFVLETYPNTSGAIFTLGIMILTTAFLALTFVPKV